MTYNSTYSDSYHEDSRESDKGHTGEDIATEFLEKLGYNLSKPSSSGPHSNDLSIDIPYSVINPGQTSRSGVFYFQIEVYGDQFEVKQLGEYRSFPWPIKDL